MCSYRGFVGEDVESQWFLSAVDEVNSLLQRVHSEDGQDGAENFLLH